MAAARGRGLDVTSSHDVGRDGTKDPDQLRAATRDGRCIVTENHRHFVPLGAAFHDRGEDHTAVVLTPRWIRDRATAFADALVSVASRYPDGLPLNAFIWITVAPSDDR